MYIEKVKLKNGERLPMLLDSHGLPVVAPCEWILSRRHRALNTLTRNLAELIPLYAWLDVQRVDLLELIRSARYWGEAFTNSLAEYLRRTHPQRRKVVKLAVTPDTANKRISTTVRFLSWCFDVVVSDRGLDANRRQAIQKIQAAVIACLRNARLNPEPPKRSVKKYLSAAEARFLQEVLEPDGQFEYGRNASVRIRNYLIVCLMLFYGLRPGEVLSLHLKDVEFGAISNVRVYRRGVSEDDVRSRPPSVKRAGRVLPLDNPYLAALLNKYAMRDRERFVRRGRGAGNEFFFLSSAGQPLSESSLEAIFQRLRAAYPTKLPANLTAKSLRHTFTNGLYRALRKQGVAMQEIKNILMYLRGDTAPSSQDTYIDYHEQSESARQEYCLSIASPRNAPDVPV